jgi:hypothetical protein
MQFYRTKTGPTRNRHLAERYVMLAVISPYSYSFLLDGQPLVADATRVTTSAELPNVTVTVLQIVASRPSDSGSYRCSNGHGAQSKEAKLYLRDSHLHAFLRSLAASSASSQYPTVFCLLLFLVLIHSPPSFFTSIKTTLLQY